MGINEHDMALYEKEWANSTNNESTDMQDRRDLNQLIAHAALDLIDEHIVSAFVTASGIRFLVLHDKHNDDAIRHFFVEVYEAFIKQSMNPLYKHGEKIYSIRFNQRVENIGKRYFS